MTQLIALLLVLGTLLVLAIQNPQPVVLNFLVWRSASTSLLVVILSSILVGLLCGFLLGWSVFRRSRRRGAEGDE